MSESGTITWRDVQMGVWWIHADKPAYYNKDSIRKHVKSRANLRWRNDLV